MSSIDTYFWMKPITVFDAERYQHVGDCSFPNRKVYPELRTEKQFGVS